MGQIVEEHISAEIISRLRNVYGDTYKRIGEKIGVSESFICYVANGQRSLTLEKMTLIEKVYKIPLPKLILDSIDLTKLELRMRKLYKEIISCF